MPEPRPLRDEINKLMARRGYGRAGGDAALAAAWRDAVESLRQSADGTRSLRLSRRTLHVGVASASRRGELDGFYKDALLQALQTRHPQLDIRNLKFERLAVAPDAADEPWMDE